MSKLDLVIKRLIDARNETERNTDAWDDEEGHSEFVNAIHLALRETDEIATVKRLKLIFSQNIMLVRRGFVMELSAQIENAKTKQIDVENQSDHAFNTELLLALINNDIVSDALVATLAAVSGQLDLLNSYIKGSREKAAELIFYSSLRDFPYSVMEILSNCLFTEDNKIEELLEIIKGNGRSLSVIQSKLISFWLKSDYLKTLGMLNKVDLAKLPILELTPSILQGLTPLEFLEKYQGKYNFLALVILQQMAAS